MTPVPTSRRWIEHLPLGSIQAATRNAKAHDADRIGASVGRFGFLEPLVLDERTGRLVAGHGRLADLLARQARGEGPPDGIARTEDDADGKGSPDWLAPVVRGWQSRSDHEADAAALALNRAGEAGGWQRDVLAEVLEELHGSDPDLATASGFTDTDLDELLAELALDGPAPAPGPGPALGSLVERFGVPPFSVLDTRQGYWQDRKRQWLGLGIRSELGREKTLIGFDSLAVAAYGRDTPGTGAASVFGAATSVFDPVLCELVYRWWCPPGGLVYDPYAGGSVRGVVAAAMGRRYVGVDLRAEQVAANRDQWAALATALPDAPAPEWAQGDSRTARPLDRPADLVFTCPPYADLERYSDDPADLSTMGWPDFLDAYRAIAQASADQLAEDRWLVCVVSEVRDRRGVYRGLVPATVDAYTAAGLAFYNDAVLVGAVGTMAIRAAAHFPSGRKLERGHQAVLVFTKGDARAAAAACPLGPADLALPTDDGQPL